MFSVGHSCLPRKSWKVEFIFFRHVITNLIYSIKKLSVKIFESFVKGDSAIFIPLIFKPPPIR